MNTSSYLKLSRHNVYIFRRRIPKSLLDFFITNELRISTNTSNKKTALHIARRIANESDLLFERLKNNKNMTDKKDFTALNRTLEHWRETNNLKSRLEEESNNNFQAIVESKRIIKELKATHEHALTQQQDSYKLALDAVGGFVSNKLNNCASPHKVDLKLSELIEDFFSLESLLIRSNKEATVRKDRDSLKLFVEIVGDKDISKVSQSDAVKFAKTVPLHRRKDGDVRAVNTVNGFMNTVSKFSGWIAAYHSETEHKKLDFSRLHQANTKRPSDERQAFTDSEVMEILTHPEMAKFQLKEPVKYWLPYIAAYSGARLEEITQLSPVTDIYEIDGLWVFDINDKNGKSLKNNQSIRTIPIHSELIRLGLIDYVNNIKAEKAATLFPNEKIRDGRTGKNAGKRVNRFIQKALGLDNKSLHSFRHTFATKLKHGGEEEPLVAAIMGHGYGGITFNRYGKAYLPSILKLTVEKISF
jgi:integrase